MAANDNNPETVRMRILDPATGQVREPDKYDGPMLAADQGPRSFHIMIKPAGAAAR